MRGSVKGSLWAVVLAGGGLSFVSIVAPPVMQSAGPATPQIQMPQPVVVAPSAEGLALNTASDPAPAIALPQVAPAPQGEDSPVVDTTPATPPAPVAEASDITAPADGTEPEVATAADAPVADTGAATLPAPTLDTADASIDVAADDPPADDADTSPVMADTTAQDEDPAQTAETPVTETSQDSASDPAVTTTTDDAETKTADAPLVSTTNPASTATPLVVQRPAATEEAEVTTAQDADAEVEETIPQDASDGPAETPTTTNAEVDNAEVAEEPTTPASQIRINRPGTEETEPAGEESIVVSDTEEDAALPALEAFAAAFENPDDLPLLAVILVDDGTNDAAVGAVAALGFAPTVALNVLQGDAGDKMVGYRNAGVEVALQTGLPAGSQPADVEVAFEAAFDILPEAAMLFSDGSGVLQNDRAVTAQAMEVLAAQGRGFVGVQRGLGNATREAEALGVPAVAVGREIDGAGKDQRAIIRDLDQAAFRARQSGGAVILAPATAEVLAALQVWAADLDQDQLLLAPVSAVLLAQE